MYNGSFVSFICIVYPHASSHTLSYIVGSTEKDSRLAEANKELKELRFKADSWSRSTKRLEAAVEKHKKQSSEYKEQLDSAQQQIKELNDDSRKVEKQR